MCARLRGTPIITAVRFRGSMLSSTIVSVRAPDRGRPGVRAQQQHGEPAVAAQGRRRQRVRARAGRRGRRGRGRRRRAGRVRGRQQVRLDRLHRVVREDGGDEVALGDRVPGRLQVRDDEQADQECEHDDAGDGRAGRAAGERAHAAVRVDRRRDAHEEADREGDDQRGQPAGLDGELEQPHPARDQGPDRDAEAQQREHQERDRTAPPADRELTGPGDQRGQRGGAGGDEQQVRGARGRGVLRSPAVTPHHTSMTRGGRLSLSTTGKSSAPVTAEAVPGPEDPSSEPG